MPVDGPCIIESLLPLIEPFHETPVINVTSCSTTRLCLDLLVLMFLRASVCACTFANVTCMNVRVVRERDRFVEMPCHILGRVVRIESIGLRMVCAEGSSYSFRQHIPSAFV